MIITTPESLKARSFLIYRYFILYEQLKFRAQLRMKKVLQSRGLAEFPGSAHGISHGPLVLWFRITAAQRGHVIFFFISFPRHYNNLVLTT